MVANSKIMTRGEFDKFTELAGYIDKYSYKKTKWIS